MSFTTTQVEDVFVEFVTVIVDVLNQCLELP
jgi:hypothetical protein